MGKITYISKNYSESAESVGWHATGNIDLQAGTQVKMYGKQDGVQLKKNQPVTLPHTQQLLVTKVEGPMDDNGNKVEHPEEGTKYWFRATFSRIATVMEIRQLKWSRKKKGATGKESINVNYGAISKSSKVLSIETTYEAMQLYAFFKEPVDTVSVRCELEPVQLPIYVDKFKIKGMDETGTKIANDMAWGYGKIVPGQSVYTEKEIRDMGVLMRLSADQSDSSLFIDFYALGELTARGELNDNIERMIDKFKSRSGGVYDDAVLTKNAKNHDSTKRFCRSIEDEIADRLKKYKGNLNKVQHKYNNGANGDNARMTDAPYGHPRFNTTGDTFWGGLTIAVNDVWAYEVLLTDYQPQGDNYTIKYKVILWDHFGLDKPDMDKYSTWAGFRAWFVLQHLKGYKPFITKMEFEQEFKGSLNMGKNERLAQRKKEEQEATDKRTQEERMNMLSGPAF